MYKQIAILGAGVIGTGWATFFSSKGIETLVYDNNPEALKKGMHTIRKQLLHLKNLEVLSSLELEKAKKNVRAAESVEDLMGSAEYVQESVIEDYEIKEKVYRELEKYCKKSTVIASSSSGLLITKTQKALQNPERSLIAHPFNPPHLIPLVELVPGEKSDPKVIQEVKDFFEDLGKTPIVLKQEVPGHIANRLAAALWREALALVDRDVATVEDIDKALSAGPGLRWAMMGQHLIYELGGGEGGYKKFIDIIGSSFSEYWKDMEDWKEIPQSAKDKAVEGVKVFYERDTREGWLKWRDRTLVKVIKAVKKDGA